MRKLILILLFSISSTSVLKAQLFLTNENFSSTTGTKVPNGWTNNIISGDTAIDKWQFGKHPKFFFAPPFDENYAIFDSYNGGSAGGTATNAQAETVALESPSINTNGLNSLFCSFDYMNLYNGGTAFLDISIDGGSNWTSYASFASVTSTPVSVIYNFSSYIGYSSVKIRFRWNNTSTNNYQGYFAVDNVKLFSRYTTDATISGLNPMYDKSCPNASQAINIIIKNEGLNTISNVPVTVNVSGAATANLNYTYTGSITSNSSVNVSIGTINTSNGGTVNFSAIVKYSGDNNTTNDTFKATRVSASLAGNPSAIDGSSCGVGSRVSIGVSKSSGDSTFWYAQSSGGTIIAEGTPFLTPPLNSSTIFYAQNARLFANDQSAYQGPYRFNGIQHSGSYFDINASNELLIDSFWQHFAYSGNYDIYVYYKSGTYSGYENTSTAWTLHQKVSATSNGFGHMVGVKLSKALNIPAGNLFGFYILVDGLTTNKCVTFKAGSSTFSNADLTITSGVVSNNQFTGVSGYSWDGKIFYRKLCLSGQVAVNAIIKPTPTGAELIRSSPFEGKFNTGTLSEPDLMTLNQTNSYELIPPKGYTNSNHGTNWKINYLILKTEGGYNIPGTDYTYSAPSGSSNAKLSLKATNKYLDSNIIILFNFSDLGTNNCDSSVTRVVRIVPTPKPNFTFTNPACDGTPILFNNISTIHSGNMNYKWYFGDGDSSEFENNVHVYPTFGKYCVKLIATSNNYLISYDTTICITITEIPKISFKVINACEGISLNFINQTTIGTGSIKYDWDFGDGTSHSTLANPTHLYSTPNSYQVTLKATSSTNCISTLTKYANQYIRPKADFSHTGKCNKNIIEFTSHTTIGNADKFGDNWQFGDGAGNNERNPTHIYTTAGIKSVKYLTTSQFGCTDSVIKNITILPSPEAYFTNSQVCNIDPVEFYNTTFEPSGILVNYLWNFGDSTTSILKNPKHVFPDLGYTTVTLFANGNNGCSTIFSKIIKVLVQPVANFSTTDACVGNSVIFSNTTKGSGVLSYKWKFGDGDSSSLYLPIKKYSSLIPSTYNVTLTASIAGGCKNSVSKPVNITETPSCGFSFASAGTGGFEYIFTPAVTNYPFYQWSFEGGGISNSAKPKHKFLKDGKFRVRVLMRTVDGCECFDTTQFVTVYHLGTNKFGSKSSIAFYPNPNNGHFNIQVSTVAPTETFTLNILDLAGKVISTSFLTGNEKHNLVYDELTNGLYTLEIIKLSGERTTAKMNILK
jgi:PKD repeat protein